MYARTRWILNSLLVLLFSVSVASAQEGARGPDRPAFTQQQLDQMLAPIALYPDALLSQILMASTYPGEVVEAARWSRRNSDLDGDRAVRAAERNDWDPSVKSLVAFPQILDLMDEKLGWTEDMGDAFLDQEAQVMDTVQYLRRKAYTAGNLASSDQFRVDFEDASFVIRFANPEVVYVPYYNPTLIYGTWWWPAYQPVYWAPWPGYHARPGYAYGYAWGPGIAVSRGFFFGAPDWRHRSVNVVNVNAYYYRPATVNRPPEIARNANPVGGASNVWQHDVSHRREIPDRNTAWRQPAAPVSMASEARRDVRERETSAVYGRGVPVNATAPVAAVQPQPHSASSQPVIVESAVRGTGSRGQDSRGAQDSRRPETRAESTNRPADRGSYQQIVGGMGARPASAPAPVSAIATPVVSQPVVRSMPVPTNVPVFANHPAVEARPNGSIAAHAQDEARRRGDQRRDGGREHANNAAPAAGDSTVAAANVSGATTTTLNSNNSRSNGGNSRHPQ